MFKIATRFHVVSLVVGCLIPIVECVRSDEEWWWSSDPKPVDVGPGGHPACRCVPVTVGLGAATIGDSTVMFPEQVGRKCHAWDNDVYPGACEDDDQIPGRGQGWCARKWCYVDPCKCDLRTAPMQSSYFPNATYNGKRLHFSYATCDSKSSRTQSLCSNYRDEAVCTNARPCDWTGDRCVPMELAPLCSIFTKHVVPRQILNNKTNNTSGSLTNGSVENPSAANHTSGN